MRNLRSSPLRIIRPIVLLITLIALTHRKASAQQGAEPPEGLLAGQASAPARSPEPGLLFYLSGEGGPTADFAAGGQRAPNFLKEVVSIPDGAFGKGIQAGDEQLLAYWAPGNIYAQRGTLSFFWRSRYPLSPQPFPLFRVAFADHSSWDMVWLRIDYNGAGFDAFVTDIGLSRTRVSHFVDTLPGPKTWTHIALSWDETEGIRLYINGRLAQKQGVSGSLWDTGLDQFGAHSRVISPYQVQSDFNFVRGGDLDELRIYDRPLTDDNIASLARGKAPAKIPPLARNLAERRWRDEWWTRNGWNRPQPAPPLLPSAHTAVRKVEVHNAWDIKRWYWKGTDGIRETTWPGVYNMSRLPGRYDYFVLPDWDTYSRSGQTVRFQLPDEPWNQVEIWGTAWGQLTYEKEKGYDHTFAVRKKGQEKTVHRYEAPVKGGTLRFDNALIEEPIGELGVYNVQEGRAPRGSRTETFALFPAPAEMAHPGIAALAAFVNGRYPADEQTKLVGVAAGDSAPGPAAPAAEKPLPFFHILLPYESHPEGLDGVEIELPALPVKPTHGDVYPLNVRVKDPLWPLRDLADFSCSLRPNQPYTLWIDTRDRLLPGGRALYLTLAGAGGDLTPALLKGARVRLVYKARDQALAEHVADRFTQVRDLFAFIVEERTYTPRLNLYNRLMADLTDLQQAAPDHWLAKAYRYVITGKDGPDYVIPAAPAGVPQWAFLQTEYLRHLANIVNYYIDRRQIANGEFGGGLSDDDDFTNMLPGTALMGIEPEKTLRSLRLLMEGYYDQERDPYDAPLRQPSLPLFTNGLATINTDMLHAYEDGIEAVGQLQLLDYANPLHFNHGMEIAKRVLEDVTQVNSKGHRHVRSRNYSGTGMATVDPWQWSTYHSYHMLHTAYNIARYNGNPLCRKLITEMADGLLAHRDEKGRAYTDFHFSSDERRGNPGTLATWPILMAAYDLTGDDKYLQPIPGKNQDTRPFQKDSLVARYTGRVQDLAVREYINTEGSQWIDRIIAPQGDLQTDRLGGVALWRITNLYQQNFLSWKIDRPATYRSLAVYVSKANPTTIELMAYNLDPAPVSAAMSVWNIKPGRWRLRQGLDENEDGTMDGKPAERIVELQQSEALQLQFPPRKTTLIKLELLERAPTDYHERPDLGIGPREVKVTDSLVTVKVYSMGAVNAPASAVVLKDATGKVIASATVPPLRAPVNLLPEWAEVKLPIPAGTVLTGGSVQIDPDKKIVQITRANDEVKW
ncbi:LamG-like jellyroll fold domain-containing protein [Paraflavisolibacter sp. H34]|uniref:LamG-like jellyroll fold domain-containing protein n=1 Tax=Huijunlia imazamoxiresistens TaxID=3127457 RepID=UPI0030164753